MSRYPSLFCKAPAWTPLTPGTPLLWLDATYGVTTSSGKVSQWDSRTNSISFTQAASSIRPDYAATGWNSNKPVVKFGLSGGVAGYTDLRNGNTTLANCWNQFTLLITMRFASTGGGGYQTLLFADNGGSSPFGYGSDASDKERLDLHAGGADILGNTLAVQNYRVWLRRKNTLPAQSSKLNGTSSISDTGDGTDAGSSACDRVTLGGNSLVGVSAAKINVAEIILYTSYLDIDADYRAYSAAKWGG